MDKFLNETLKKESKLNKKTLEHKQILLDKLSKLYEDNPQIAPGQGPDILLGKKQTLNGLHDRIGEQLTHCLNH